MKNKRGLALITAGLLLIAAALSLTIYNFYDGFRAGRLVGQTMEHLKEEMPEKAAPESELSSEEDIPYYVLYPEMEMPVQTIDGQDYIGVLNIPVLDLELPVISQWSYPGLRISPCRYNGSAYTDDLIIAAHNYSSHFGRLKNLTEDDIVTFTDVDGNAFTYTVALCEVLNPTDISGMESGGWDLTLFTCTVGGSYRVTVRCERILN